MAVDSPETRYARTADGLHIAYQVVGDGPFDLVAVLGYVSHVELSWEDPAIAAWLRELSSFSRLILFDRRGLGLSDPVQGAPTLEDRMQDLRAVMDAAGSERAALFGLSEGGPMSVLFAATYPERVSALVLYGTFARMTATADYPGVTRRKRLTDSWKRRSKAGAVAIRWMSSLPRLLTTSTFAGGGLRTSGGRRVRGHTGR